MRRKLELTLETILFQSRWLMAPFYLGLVAALAALLFIFLQDLWHTFSHFLSLDENTIIIWVLTLIDLSLAGNLIVMVILSGYENFVSKIESADHHDRPSWMGTIDFSGMKLKLVASIVAISAIELLKAFMQIGDSQEISTNNLLWMVVIHVTFVVSGVLLALMDWIIEKSHNP